MIRSIIVDDELKSRETLATLLERYCADVSVIGVAGDIKHARELIDSHDPQLVFLDITMPGGNGFDLLQQFEERDFEVIFITAYDEYAIRAVKVQAIDYLLKPLNITELQKAVALAARRLQERRSKAQPATAAPAHAAAELNLAIPVADGIQFVPMQQIIYLCAKGSYTEIHCTTGVILSSRPLKDYEQKLPQGKFFRVHHSHIINLACVKYYYRGDGGYVTMTDGSVVDISKRKKNAFLELFQV